jgi:hypothetical protein
MAEPGVIFDVNGAFYPLRKFNVSSSEGLVKGDEEHAVPDFVSDWPTGLTPSRGGEEPVPRQDGSRRCPLPPKGGLRLRPPVPLWLRQLERFAPSQPSSR